MTTVREFAEKIGVRPCDVGSARIRLQREEKWPGEELREVIICRTRGGMTAREVRSLSPEQQEAIMGNFIEMVKSERTRVTGVIDFVRDYKEVTEGGVPEGAFSPRGREREGGETPRKYPPHPIA